MTYSGEVKVGGPADVHELTDLMISKVAVGPMDNNAYLLRCRATGEQLLIDAANEAGHPARADRRRRHRVRRHHPSARRPLAGAGRGGRRPPARVRTRAGTDAEGIPVPDRCPVDDGDTIRVGRVTLTARHLVGHTPGSIALVYDDPHGHPHVFTGDCLFPGGVGNTHKDPEALHHPAGRRRDQALRPAARRDLGLPGPRQRHDARRRAAAPAASGAHAAGEEKGGRLCRPPLSPPPGSGVDAGPPCRAPLRFALAVGWCPHCSVPSPRCFPSRPRCRLWPRKFPPSLRRRPSPEDRSVAGRRRCGAADGSGMLAGSDATLAINRWADVADTFHDRLDGDVWNDVSKIERRAVNTTTADRDRI